jgi:serine protease SohB
MWMNVAEFAAKTFLIVMAISMVSILIAVLVSRAKLTRESLQVENINAKLNELERALRGRVLTSKAFKAFTKKLKKQKPVKEDEKKRLYVLQFDGDVKASGVDRLREEVTAILTVIRPEQDEVVLKLESPGGMVHSYGLAATQLLRIRERKIPLTICVDKVAASGGYMMACTGTKILAAPFAIVGSIGVVAQVPNVHKLLKKHDVDYEEVTAGEYKRTVSILGEITPKGRQKFQEKIETTHVLFKDFVTTYRPGLNIEEVATGDYWYGRQAIELGLVDEIMSSDDYLFQHRETAKIFRLELHTKKKLSDRLAENFGTAIEKAFLKGWKHILSKELV